MYIACYPSLSFVLCHLLTLIDPLASSFLLRLCLQLNTPIEILHTRLDSKIITMKTLLGIDQSQFGWEFKLAGIMIGFVAAVFVLVFIIIGSLCYCVRPEDEDNMLREHAYTRGESSQQRGHDHWPRPAIPLESISAGQSSQPVPFRFDDLICSHAISSHHMKTQCEKTKLKK